MISVPPFKVTGQIHVMPERNLREALNELTGRFIPVTAAAFWSDVLGEARQTAELVAVNHSRAQILAPHTFVDPWADTRPGGAAAGAGADAPGARGRGAAVARRRRPTAATAPTDRTDGLGRPRGRPRCVVACAPRSRT